MKNWNYGDVAFFSQPRMIRGRSKLKEAERKLMEAARGRMRLHLASETQDSPVSVLIAAQVTESGFQPVGVAVIWREAQ